jgi:uncharacterized protein YjbI with pentapeptide repeats
MRWKNWLAYLPSFLARRKKFLIYLFITLLALGICPQIWILLARLWGAIANLWNQLSDEETKLKFIVEGIQLLTIFLLGAIATVAVGVALYFNIRIAYKNTNLLEKRLEDQRFHDRNRLIIERFSKSVEQLNSSKLQVRIGGIYSLEQIAIESSRDHWTIVEILTSFIQESFPLQLDSYDQSVDGEDELPEIAIDVQAALTVIGRRNFAQDPEGKYLNLSFTYLVGADLSRAKLSGADLSKAGLIGAILVEADLSGAILSGAYLVGADLSRADLIGADLIGANLWKANLSRADLARSGLIGADLSGAKLCRANLSGAYLSGANFSGADLWRANLRRADLWKADLIRANLREADLREADLWKANLNGATLNGATLSGADFSGAKNLTPEQIKSAQDWRSAKYDEEFRQQLE